MKSCRRVAALYDIHGNLPALEVVLEQVRQLEVDQIVVGGDVFPGPMANQALERLLDLEIPTAFIRGNGDREVLAIAAGGDASGVPEVYRPAMRWVAQQLQPEHERVMQGWPASIRVTIAGLGDVMFCHATPRNDTEIFTRRTAEAQLIPVFEDVSVAVVVCGHTHMQFDRSVGQLRVVNAGSVGMPFAPPGAYWLSLGPELELHHTPYDLEAAAARIRATAYPQAEEFAANNVLDPPIEAVMLDRFTDAELR